MSHTFKSKSRLLDARDPDGYAEILVAIHDQGLDGRVTLRRFVQPSCWDQSSPISGNQEPHGELEVDKRQLIEFVAELVRGEKISKLEQLDDLQVLGLDGGA